MMYKFRMYVDETALTRYGLSIEAESEEQALQILQQFEDGDHTDLDWEWEQQEVPEEGERQYYLLAEKDDRTVEKPITLPSKITPYEE